MHMFLERRTGKTWEREIWERDGKRKNCSFRGGTTEGRREVGGWEEMEGHVEGADAGTTRPWGRGQT